MTYSSREERMRVWLFFLAGILAARAGWRSEPVAGVVPPALPREFRGAWVASVANIDWPSRPGLPSEVQRKELIAILDRAAQLRLNAVILQVRPACDALYQSSFEPWSEYLTGKMGRPPVPLYDPLQFAVQEAHARGLELHAWINPFRASHTSAQSAVSADHISRRRPNLVRRYGEMLWLDPGEAAARDYVVQVVLDIVRRYDVDAIHLDDYFYPYPVKDRKGKTIDFPDGPSWKAYQQSGGKLSRADWRRNNVDSFVERLYRAIKAERSWVKVGISPFGIWRSGYPPQIRGFDAFENLYADARRWLREGWLDYCAPQLYWPIEQREQSFPVLMKWWDEQNKRGRHIWPGLAVNRIGKHMPATEIVEQIRLTRRSARASGHILWSMKDVLENRGGIASALGTAIYSEVALVPSCSWLDPTPPQAPRVWAEAGGEVRWASTGGKAVHAWIVQYRTRGMWRTSLVSAGRGKIGWQGGAPEIVAVSAVDRVGNQGPPAVMKLIGP